MKNENLEMKREVRNYFRRYREASIQKMHKELLIKEDKVYLKIRI